MSSAEFASNSAFATAVDVDTSIEPAQEATGGDVALIGGIVGGVVGVLCVIGAIVALVLVRGRRLGKDTFEANQLSPAAPLSTNYQAFSQVSSHYSEGIIERGASHYEALTTTEI